jgi:glucokinase
MPYTGESGMAMEFGHLCVNHEPDARLCGCGNYGCIEAYASATSVAAQYFEKTHKRCNSQDIYQCAMSGEDNAIQILEASGVYLGQAIAEAIKLLDIHTVSIGGGMVGAWELFYPRLIKTLDHKLISPLKGKINVLPTTLHDNAGILGAASLALKAS